MATFGGPKLHTDGLICSLDTSNPHSYAGRPTENYLVTSAWGQVNSQGRSDQRPFNYTSHSSHENATAINPHAPRPPRTNTNVWRIYNSSPDNYSRFTGWAGMNVTTDLGTYDFDYVASSYVYLPPNVALGTGVQAMVFQSTTTSDWHGNWSATTAALYNSQYAYWTFNPMVNSTVNQVNLSERGRWQRIHRSFKPSLAVRDQEIASSVVIDKLTGYFNPSLMGQSGHNFYYVTATCIERGTHPSRTFVQGSRPYTAAIKDLSGCDNHVNLNSTTVFDQAGDDAPIYGNHSSGTIPHSADFNDMSEMTVEMWIRPTAYSTDAGLSNILLIKGWENEGAWYIGFASEVGSNDFRFALQLDGAVRMAAVDLVLDEWQHVVCTYSQTENRSRIYLNGQLSYERSIAVTSPLVNFGDLSVGRSAGTDPTFNGKMEVLKIYRNEFPPARVLQHYMATRKRFGH